MISHNHILPLSWSTSSQFDGQRRRSSLATVAVGHWVTPRSLSIPTSRRSAGAHTVESHSYVSTYQFHSNLWAIFVEGNFLTNLQSLYRPRNSTGRRSRRCHPRHTHWNPREMRRKLTSRSVSHPKALNSDRLFSFSFSH